MHCSPQHQGARSQAQPLFNTPQCPITQSQCEQLLSFLASQSFKEANSSLASHQVALVLSPLSNAIATVGTNFLGNPFWLPPNPSHSIFSARIVDR